MKKLYFLNEEESKRILNLHKEATKKHYLSEQDVNLSASEGGDNYGTIPGGISREAYDDIMAVSEKLKNSNLKSPYLGGKESEGIDNRHGPGTYEKFINDGGNDVLRNGGLPRVGGFSKLISGQMKLPDKVEQIPPAEKAAAEKAAAEKAAAALKASTVSTATKGPLVTNIQKILISKGINLGTSGPNKDGVDGVMGNITLNGIVSLLGGGTSTDAVTKAVTTTGTPVGGTTLSSNTTPTGSVAKTPTTPVPGTKEVITPVPGTKEVKTITNDLLNK
jgi:hypothetical protein